MHNYYVGREAEVHENWWFFSTGMEFAKKLKNAYVYMLKALRCT